MMSSHQSYDEASSVRLTILTASERAGSGQLKLAVRLHNNRLQLFYPRTRFASPFLRVSEMKSVPVFDGQWHTVIISVTADRLATTTDCRKRKQRRMRRPFPTFINIGLDEVHIATCGRRSSERFRVRHFKTFRHAMIGYFMRCAMSVINIISAALGYCYYDIVCYNNFWRSDEGVRLQCEFDIAAGVSAEDIKDIVFSKFYDIAITTK